MSHGAVAFTPFGQASDARFALDLSKEVAGEVAGVGLGGTTGQSHGLRCLLATCGMWIDTDNKPGQLDCVLRAARRSPVEFSFLAPNTPIARGVGRVA